MMKNSRSPMYSNGQYSAAFQPISGIQNVTFDKLTSRHPFYGIGTNNKVMIAGLW